MGRSGGCYDWMAYAARQVEPDCWRWSYLSGRRPPRPSPQPPGSLELAGSDLSVIASAPLGLVETTRREVSPLHPAEVRRAHTR